MSTNDLTNIGKKVLDHDERLERAENIQDEHTIQLRIQAEKIKQLQDNAIKLENVVMSENRETRLTITETNKQLHELINGLMGYKAEESTNEKELRIARLESIAKIIGILAGSGGILYYILGG